MRVTSPKRPWGGGVRGVGEGESGGVCVRVETRECVSEKRVTVEGVGVEWIGGIVKRGVLHILV